MQTGIFLTIAKQNIQKRNNPKGRFSPNYIFEARKQREKDGLGCDEGYRGIPVFFTTVKTSKDLMTNLEIDFTQTFKELKNWIEAYNKKLKENKPQEFRKLSVKSTHMETAKEIIRFYGAYLYKARNGKNYSKRFWITNTGIGKAKLQHRATIYRHILVLGEARIISKIFHGSNCGIEVEINSLILVAKNNASLSFALVDNQLQRQGTSEQLTEILSAKKTFDYILNGSVATCNDNDSGHLRETKNVNMQSETVDNFFLDFKGKKQDNNGRKQGSKKPVFKQDSNFSSSSDAIATEGDPHTRGAREKIEMYTLHTWTFVKSVLWKKQIFTPEQVAQAKQCIREFYEAVKPSKLEKSIDSLYNQYLERIMLAYHYVRKAPNRFIPVPWLYLDMKFKFGFAGTKEWFKTVQERRAKNKNYYSNLSLLVKLYSNYKANPCLQTFKENEKLLQNKQDPQLMEIYYNCILDREKFNSEYLQYNHIA